MRYRELVKRERLPGTGATFSRATHRKSPTFSFLMSKATPFLCSSLTNSCLRNALPLPSQHHFRSNENKHIQNSERIRHHTLTQWSPKSRHTAQCHRFQGEDMQLSLSRSCDTFPSDQSQVQHSLQGFLRQLCKTNLLGS